MLGLRFGLGLAVGVTVEPIDPVTGVALGGIFGPDDDGVIADA